ncbi:hypothetical protein BDY21DRAFT_322520 [Lineolata rhizophorae]|uniref:SH3 domain-containing protein n=1 Tax=Lineolata rhizophorae TaxID=578093 RepID=A0A6A6NXM9_9PEZI|nr:hypothetical protein BDY21DRAFT_322520 [Lineolata rhizophorae]
MQRMQRKFGAFLPRSADESQVATLLHEFEQADKMLGKLVEDCRAWKVAWTGILTHQANVAHEFDFLYQPIHVAGEGATPHQPVATPEEVARRAMALRNAQEELRTDMAEQLEAMDGRLIGPALEARDAMQPMKKVMKKREDKKLDYERYKSRVEALQKKSRLSERENVALAKHESDLARSTQEYNDADEHLRACLPGIVSAAYSILPYFLSAQIMIQNDLLGQLYTVLHTHCQDLRLPSTPPEMGDVVAAWSAVFDPVRQDVEANLAILRSGKTVHQPMALHDRSPRGSQSSASGQGGLGSIRNGFNFRRPSAQSQTQVLEPSPSQSEPPPQADTSLKPKISSLNASKPRVPSSSLGTPSPGGDAAQPDYFAQRPPRMPSSQNLRPTLSAKSSSLSLTPTISNPQSPFPPGTAAAAAAAKKKPPPPPPKPRRVPSAQTEWVTALYDFAGQSEGDLAFKEGDRIKVVRRTESVHDWWEGEVGGVRGSFPANYCSLG